MVLRFLESILFVGYLSDLWQYSDGSISEEATSYWQWSGLQTFNSVPTYGTLNVPSLVNSPGGREHASTWMDSSKNLWMYGGAGHNDNKTCTFLIVKKLTISDIFFSDLWKYDGNAWTWMGGFNKTHQSAVYSGSNQHPGGRAWAQFWKTSNGSLYLFGGRVSLGNTE